MGVKRPKRFSTKPIDNDFILEQDAWPIFQFFLNLQNYWLHGFNGITGLDHQAVIERIKLFEKGRYQQQWLLQGIEAIESGVMQALSDNKRLADDALDSKEKTRLKIKSLSQTERNDIKERQNRRT